MSCRNNSTRGWLWMIVALASISWVLSDPTKCLQERPEVRPKKYLHFTEKSSDIVVATSNRVIHRITTEIFKVFLEEIVGFASVKIVQRDDGFDVRNVIDSLSQNNVSIPDVIINLETWIPPDDDNVKLDHYVKECGNSLPPGRFGWFIPKHLDAPVKNYYKKWVEDIDEVHWSILKDKDSMSAFAVTGDRLDDIMKMSKIPGTQEHFCNDTMCQDGMYVPPQCKNPETSCALMLTDHLNYTKFVIDHITHLDAYVKVIWLGDNLKSAVELLNSKIDVNSGKSYLILHWTPSHIILRQTDYISVTFPHCSVHNLTASLGCKYELSRLLKLSWIKLESFAPILFQAMCSFRIDEDALERLLDLYEKNRSYDSRQIACQWMQNNEFVWINWRTDNEPTQLYIGGIFPMTGSSYHGGGIAMGAKLAQQAINNNKSILPDYQLNVIVSNGQCRADSVMKAFIDYIVDGFYKNLIGVLGPACSDTVEPLAGVSKHYRIMVISYSAEGASFSDRHKYPYFFRTIGENKFYKHVYLQLFKRFGWKQVASLTEDGQKYTEYISFMHELLVANGIKFVANIKFAREAFSGKRYLQDLKTVRARIIILDVFDEIARKIMCEASKSKMTSADGYVWFLPTWLNQTWYDTDYFNKHKKESVPCTTSEMIKAINGYFSMAHAYWAPDDSTIPENITVAQWRKNYELSMKTMADPVPSNYAGYAYDAVWVYAYALHELIKENPEAISELHSENTTNKLLQKIKETDFNGVSGRIKFRGGPSRFSVINVLEWYGNASHMIGQFTPNLTDDRPEILGGILALNETALRWFTADGRHPVDGAAPADECGVAWLASALNVSCHTAYIIPNVVIVFILIVIVCFVVYYIKRHYDQKVALTASYMKKWGIEFMMGAVNSADLDKWEMPRSSVVINRKLGEGAFGTVYGGEAELPNAEGVKRWVAVAVKTLKIGSTTEQKLDFLSEAEVMKRFEHKNVIKLLGVCTTEEPVYTVMEFMLYGDLKTYLLARRHLVYLNRNDETDEVSDKKLTSMALDVARGLSYLAEMKFVHRDVASRNCLVNANRVVKLADFGMTRPMFENDYYRFTRRGMLPVRWMAPESLAQGVFTPASDVWSYGVILFEIVTFGSFPYQGMTNTEVLDFVKNGNILKIPDAIKGQLRSLMLSCWNQDPTERWRAAEIVEFLANNPRLLHPCLDDPLASVQLEDSDDVEINLPEPFRKFSAANVQRALASSGGVGGEALPSGSGVLRNGAATLIVDAQVEEGHEMAQLGSSSPKEPLLGNKAKSSASLMQFSKFPKVTSDDDDDDDDVDESDLSHLASGYSYKVPKA